MCECQNVNNIFSVFMDAPHEVEWEHISDATNDAVSSKAWEILIIFITKKIDKLSLCHYVHL